MHDIAYIRANPETFDAAMTSRGGEPVAQRVITLDAKRREATTKVQGPNHQAVAFKTHGGLNAWTARMWAFARREAVELLRDRIRLAARKRHRTTVQSEHCTARAQAPDVA